METQTPFQGHGEQRRMQRPFLGREQNEILKKEVHDQPIDIQALDPLCMRLPDPSPPDEVCWPLYFTQETETGVLMKI